MDFNLFPTPDPAPDRQAAGSSSKRCGCESPLCGDSSSAPAYATAMHDLANRKANRHLLFISRKPMERRDLEWIANAIDDFNHGHAMVVDRDYFDVFQWSESDGKYVKLTA